LGIQLSPEGVHGGGVCIGDCPGISIGLGLGAALRLVVLRAVFLAGLRAAALLPRFFLALLFAARFFRATLSPPLRS